MTARRRPMTSPPLLGTFRSTQLPALLLIAVAALGGGCVVDASDEDLGIAEQPITVGAALESDSAALESDSDDDQPINSGCITVNCTTPTLRGPLTN